MNSFCICNIKWTLLGPTSDKHRIWLIFSYTQTAKRFTHFFLIYCKLPIICVLIIFLNFFLSINLIKQYDINLDMNIFISLHIAMILKRRSKRNDFKLNSLQEEKFNMIWMHSFTISTINSNRHFSMISRWFIYIIIHSNYSDKRDLSKWFSSLRCHSFIYQIIPISFAPIFTINVQSIDRESLHNYH